MKTINVKGTIVNNSVAEFYEWMGIEATSPKSVIDALPSTNDEVEVIINSGGGDVFAGSEIFTALKEYAGQVTVKIVGLAASVASVIAMAGDKILISPTGQMMIHNVSTSAQGDYRDFEHVSETLKSANQSIINAYKTRLDKTDEELQQLMDAETWFNANTALEHGFVDEIMFDEKVTSPLVANFGSIVLNDEIISKISAMKQREAMQARLNIMKQKGEEYGSDQ